MDVIRASSELDLMHLVPKSSDSVSDKGFCDSLGQLSFRSDLQLSAGEVLALMSVKTLARVHMHIRPEARSKASRCFFKALYYPTLPTVTYHLSNSYLQSPLWSCRRPRSSPRRSPVPSLRTACFVYFRQSVMEEEETESVEKTCAAFASYCPLAFLLCVNSISLFISYS